MIREVHANSPLLREVVEVLVSSLMLSADAGASLESETRLFGNLPELDSMAVATVLTAIEDRFHIVIDDEDVTAEMFDTVGSLVAFVQANLPH